MTFEYKVVPAPTRGMKAKGLKTQADRFAHALAALMNELAAEGWEYQRTDTLPAEERHGLTSRSTVFQNMLIFRRPAEAAAGSDAAEETNAASESPEAAMPKLPSAADAQSVPDTEMVPAIVGTVEEKLAAE